MLSPKYNGDTRVGRRGSATNTSRLKTILIAKIFRKATKYSTKPKGKVMYVLVVYYRDRQRRRLMWDFSHEATVEVTKNKRIRV
jgi:hypothetical protein